MVIQSPNMDLQIPETDVLTYLFGHAQPSDQPIWIDATNPRKHLSARSLLQWAKRLALGLDRLGIKPGEVVLICSPNHIFVPAAYLGIIGSGRIFSGANPAYTADELSHQIRDSSARILLVHPGFVETARTALQNTGLSEDCLFLFSDEEIKPTGGVKDWRSLLGSEEEAERYKWTRLGSESKQKIATINFSSGTTGLPKGVIITHFNLIANVEQLIFNTRAQEGSVAPSTERWVGFLPLYHAFGQLYTCLMAARLSTPVYIMKTFVFEDFLKVIETHRITDIQVAPPILVMLRKRPETSKYDLSSLRSIVCGAAPLSGELQDSCANHYNVSVNQGWGMTEVTCAGTGFPAGVQGLAGSIGMLLPNCEARIVDETGNEVKAHEKGEMYIRGPNISLGYWRNQEATAKSMLPGGWLRTGDVAVHDEEGRLWIVDRLKELIKVNGLQVAPAELEAVLLKNDDIADAAVVGIKLNDNDEEWPRAYVALKDSAKGDVAPQDVQRWIKTRVAKHKWLQGGVVFVDVVPKSPAGKIQRKVMREWAAKDAKTFKVAQKAKL